jgi:hypothetical protein
LGKGCYITALRISALDVANTSSVSPVTPAVHFGKRHWKYFSTDYRGHGPRPVSLSEHAWSALVRKPESDHPASNLERFFEQNALLNQADIRDSCSSLWLL